MAYEKLKDENYNNLGGINQKVSEYLTGNEQFLDIRNYGFERPGAFTSRPGFSDFASLANTTYLSTPHLLYEFIKSQGTSFLLFDSGSTLFALGGAAVASSLTPNATTGYNIDVEVMNDYMYFANGYTYQRYDGTNSVLYGVPEQRQGIVGKGASFDINIFPPNGLTTTIRTGQWAFRYAPVKGGPTFAEGQPIGPIGERAADDDTGLDLDYVRTVGSTIVGQGSWVVWGFTIPLGFGVSSVLPYARPPGISTFYASPTIYPFTLGLFNGATYYAVIFSNFEYDTAQDTQFQFSLAPRYLANYNNMLFMSGFSTLPSRVFFSDPGAPEDVEEENFVDVRTSNGDVITNMIVYQTTLVVFKKRSCHEINGFSPDTLSLKDVNLIYGCVNDTAAVTFENKLWFCDERGICEYNGPDTFIVSYPVEEILSTLDKSLCKAIYIKEREEVWFNFGNISLIYNHHTESWTIYDGINIQNSQGARLLSFGSTTSSRLSFVERGASFVQFSRFGQSTYTDRGVAITLLFQTRFHKRLGDSTQEMWRRFYLNNNIVANHNVTINLYSDYASSSSHVISTNLDEFQSRIEFGVSAKSLSAEVIMQATEKITVYGYTIESRYLRSC